MTNRELARKLVEKMPEDKYEQAIRAIYDTIVYEPLR